MENENLARTKRLEAETAKLEKSASEGEEKPPIDPVSINPDVVLQSEQVYATDAPKTTISMVSPKLDVKETTLLPSEEALVDLLAQVLLDRLEDEMVSERLAGPVAAQVRALQAEEAAVALLEKMVPASATNKTATEAFTEVFTGVFDNKTTGTSSQADPANSPNSLNKQTLRLWFDHGLGDCANFTAVLELYRRRGYEIELHCADDKAIVFAPIKAHYIPLDTPVDYVQFPESRDPELGSVSQYWLYNKTATSVSVPPLPNIGTPEHLWTELCEVCLDSRSAIGPDAWTRVHAFLRDLPRPIVLLHSMGNTFQDAKNLPEHVALATYKEILERTEGTLVLLDWDDRVPRLASGRVRHMTDDWEWIDVETLLALMYASDLLISVDSGPLHLARLTDIPVIGIFPSLNKYPSRVLLPRRRSVCLVPSELTAEYNRQTRLLFNIVEFPGSDLEQAPSVIGETCARMLAGPRYLSAMHLGADVQLQQFVRDWERGHPNDLTSYNDRHRGFDVLLRETGQRFSAPVMVETGCIRGEEDWQGAGFGTYLLGAFLERHGGSLASVDIDAENCAFARMVTLDMPSVTITEGDSVPFLAEFGRPIDVLVLDSMDTYVDGFAEHALREIESALPWLHSASIVMFDDTVYSRRGYTGKGTIAVPWLLDQGWRILHSGYQVICVRC